MVSDSVENWAAPELLLTVVGVLVVAGSVTLVKSAESYVGGLLRSS